jgi:hypothetical protein
MEAIANPEDVVMESSDKLVPGELYELNREVYDWATIEDPTGILLVDAPLGQGEPDDKHLFLDQKIGMYLGPGRINVPRKGKRGKVKSSWRKLVHIFMWSGQRVALKAEWVREAI